jgi:hypothetical protein
MFTALLALAGGCAGGGTEPAEERPTSYQFALAAFGTDTTPEGVRDYECVLGGYFTLPTPLPDAGTAVFPVRAWRALRERHGTQHYEQTTTDTTIEAATLEFTGLRTATVRLRLRAGPYAADLAAGREAAGAPREHAGPWRCDGAFPLARDSALARYGQDPDLALDGTWRLSELQPFE